MDKKKIEGLRRDINTFLGDAVTLLKEVQDKAYDEREIDLLKPIAKVINTIQDNKVKMAKELDKLSKMKSTW